MSYLLQSLRRAGRIDRSCFGHIATYCFASDAWQPIENGFKSRERVAEGRQRASNV